jgi:hypothetical protein
MLLHFHSDCSWLSWKYNNQCCIHTQEKAYASAQPTNNLPASAVSEIKAESSWEDGSCAES